MGFRHPYLNDLDPARNAGESLRVLKTSLRTPVITVTGSIAYLHVQLIVLVFNLYTKC